MNMDLDIYKYWVLIMIPASFIGLYVSLSGIRKEIPSEDRGYMDPVPKKLRKIWPLVNFFAFYFGERLSVEILVKTEKMLTRAGLNYMMSSSQYFGLKMTSAFLMSIMMGLCCYMIGHFDSLYLILALALGYIMPSLSVNDIKKRREKNIVRSLPTYLDFLTLATQAGLNVSAAVLQAVEKGPESPLKQEFRKYLRDLRAGMSRDDALRAMADRLDIAEINAFTTAVIQAEKTGASVGNTLKAQSDQRRTERFQKAEKLAMEAPVKLIFPLVVFIFPTTFIIIFFPIAMKLMETF